MINWQSNYKGEEVAFFGDGCLRIVAHERYYGLYALPEERLCFEVCKDNLEANKDRAINLAEEYLALCLLELRSMK